MYLSFEVFTAVTMKNAVFWDMQTQFIPHRKLIISPPHNPAGQFYVCFDVFTVMTMKNAVFWDMKTQFVPHRKNITSPLQIPAG
jgi:hypothetical protein